MSSPAGKIPVRQDSGQALTSQFLFRAFIWSSAQKPEKLPESRAEFMSSLVTLPEAPAPRTQWAADKHAGDTSV